MTSPQEERGKLTEFVKSMADLGNQEVYATFHPGAQAKYRPKYATISRNVIEQHLAGKQPIGCYFVVGDETRTATIDLDDHDKSMDWEEMAEAAKLIVAELESSGLKPLCCRSGGGAGVHIWLFWESRQNALMVKTFLRALVKKCGFRHGTKGGVQNKVVEVFPKNDKVAKGKPGNLIALPFARKSVPLDDELDPVPLEKFDAPDMADFFSPDIASIYKPSPSNLEARKERKDTERTAPSIKGDALPGDEKEVVAALKYVDADDYDVWIKTGMALKQSFGEAGRQIWDIWSGSSAKYEGGADISRRWEAFRPDGELTVGSIFYWAREAGWKGPSNKLVREMNSRFGILTHGSSTRIIVKEGEENEVLTWLGKNAFHDRLIPEKFPVDLENGDTKWVSKSYFWIAHRLANHYHKLDFDPSKPPGHNGNVWNLWQGFAVSPNAGSWERLKDHILHNICGGISERYEWMLNWMALGIQEPATVIGTAPVLMGLPGTGKGILANAYGALWKPHFVSITKDDHVSGRFNHHLMGRRLVYVDEAIFGGDRRNAGVIKTMVTEPKIMIEQKGVDPIFFDNHMIFMVTSNERSVVPADIGDRRWQVFEVSDNRREDREYFSALVKELQNGGYQAMLHELQTRDITNGPDPRRTIRTPELFEQIIQAQGPVEKYVYQFLEAGYLPQGEAPGNGAGVTTIAAIYADMKQSQPNAQYIHQTLLGRSLSKIFRGIEKVQSGKFITGYNSLGVPRTERSMRYHFPPLKQCRKMFEDYIGQTVPWDRNVEEWMGDVDPPFKYEDPDDQTPF